MVGLAVAVLLPALVVLGSRLGKDATLMPTRPHREARPGLHPADPRREDDQQRRPAGQALRRQLLGVLVRALPGLEHGSLRVLLGALPERGHQLLGVIIQDSPAAARAFQAELGGDWPLLSDPKDQTAGRLRRAGPARDLRRRRRGRHRLQVPGPPRPRPARRGRRPPTSGKVPNRPGGVAEWFRQGSAKPCTAVQFRSPPLIKVQVRGPFC